MRHLEGSRRGVAPADIRHDAHSRTEPSGAIAQQLDIADADQTRRPPALGKPHAEVGADARGLAQGDGDGACSRSSRKGQVSGSTEMSAPSPKTSTLISGVADTRARPRLERELSVPACNLRAGVTVRRTATARRVAWQGRSRRCAARPARAVARSPRVRTPGSGPASRDSGSPVGRQGAAGSTGRTMRREAARPRPRRRRRRSGATSSASPHMNCVS